MYRMSAEDKVIVESLYEGLYQVRFDLRDAKASSLGLNTGKYLGQRYGVTNQYGDDEEVLKYAKKGCLLVSDAILPDTHVFERKDLTEVPLDYDGEFNKFIEAAYDEASKISDALPDGVHVGALFSIGVADGSASYIVTKVNKKTCDVEWRGFGGPDRYVDHFFGWGREKVNISDVERYVRRSKGLASIFKVKN